jgi:acyl-coenzyme A synthetase/AMP-(fatty) acid ligase
MLVQINKFEGICMVDRDQEYLFSEFSTQINDYISFLSQTIKKNDVIVINSDSNFFSISLLFALSEFQVIIVPIVFTTQNEFEIKISVSQASKELMIDDSGKITIIDYKSTSKTMFENYDKILRQKHTGLVLFSSGTTGQPKLMVHDFSNMLNLLTISRKQRKLRIILFLLFDHIGGINSLINTINNGSTIILPINRKPESIIECINKYDVNVLPTSPTFLNLMLMSENFGILPLDSLKLITYGTERMSASLLEKLSIKLPKVRLLQTFGTSETGIIKTQSVSSNSLFFKFVDENIEYKIISNELYLKTLNTVSGYNNYDSSNFLDDGWFRTGDIVEMDSDENIKIIGRINDIINVGGLKVFPSEIENIINQIEGVIDTTVFGKENAITGQIVCAKVVIDKTVSEEEIKKTIRNQCRINLDKYKIPSKIIVINKIETTSRFKKA